MSSSASFFGKLKKAFKEPIYMKLEIYENARIK